MSNKNNEQYIEHRISSAVEYCRGVLDDIYENDIAEHGIYKIIGGKKSFMKSVMVELFGTNLIADVCDDMNYLSKEAQERIKGLTKIIKERR